MTRSIAEPVASAAHTRAPPRNPDATSSPPTDEAPPPTAPPPSPPPSPPAAASQGSSVPIKVLAAASLLLLAAVLYNSMGGWQSQAHTMGLKRPAAPMLQRRVRKSRYAEDADHPETVFVPRLFNRTKALEDARARMSGRQTRWSTRLAKAATIDGLAKGGGGASAKLGEAPFARGKGLGGRKASLFAMLSDGEGGIGNAFRRMRNATDAQTKKAATLAAALAGNITSPIGAQLAARRSALAAGSSPEDAAALHPSIVRDTCTWLSPEEVQAQQDQIEVMVTKLAAKDADLAAKDVELAAKDALAEKNAQQRDAELAAKDAELEAAMVAKDAALKKVADLERLLGAAASDHSEQ